jgi:hypothetical protein
LVVPARHRRDPRFRFDARSVHLHWVAQRGTVYVEQRRSLTTAPAHNRSERSVAID